MHHARRATIALFAAALIVSACGTGDADHTASPATADAPISTTATATDTDTEPGASDATVPATGSASDSGDAATAPTAPTASTDGPEIPPPYEPPVLDAVTLADVPARPAAPAPQAAPVQVHFDHDPTDTLTGNAVGCDSNCITAASLVVDPNGTTATLHVTTNVNTRLALWLSPAPIVTTNGVPDFAEDAEIAIGQPLLQTSWDRTVTGLRPDVEYHAILRARDVGARKQYLTGTFHTPAAHGPSEEGVAAGCATQCITAGTVAAGSRYPTATLEVATSVDATLSVWVSTDEPGWIGGAPILPATAKVAVPAGAARNWAIDVPVLAAGAVHHVIVRAEDAHGVSYRVGSFVSGEEPPTRVIVTIERVWITQDGDPMEVDRGDATVLYGLTDEPNPAGNRLSAIWNTKLGAGDEFVPPANAWVADVLPGGTLPGIGMTIWESDPQTHGCAGGVPFVYEPHYDDWCNNRANVAYINLVTLADTEDWLACSSYGFIGSKEDAACRLVSSATLNEQYVNFAILVSVQVI
ncbi:MAG: hypothetical protein KDB12_15555 [Ilumatobacter sp.]|nr:hypothetical protein [Ilumatobacter sp.]